MFSLRNRLESAPFKNLLLAGVLVRCILLLYSVYHDKMFRVKYTDIDYMIIVDGAKEVLSFGSPFDRTTYRYTPLLAFLMIPAAGIANPLGKLLFCLCDIGAAHYSYFILQAFSTERSSKLMVSIFILFNPIVLNVSTRGNSDMLITFMSLMVLAKFWEGSYFKAAAILGFAIHFKLYPVIYALPLVLGIWVKNEGLPISRRLIKSISTSVLCGIICLICFAIPTFFCYKLYGDRYLDEAFLYHLRREDHRHNFSPYWLLMYLNMGARHAGLADYTPGYIAFLPQAIVLFYVAWRLRRNIAHACCVQTVLFVAFNKVCTVQYFVWFLPFFAFLFSEPSNLSLHEDSVDKRKSPSKAKITYKRPGFLKIVTVIFLWCLTIPLWVFSAIPLEFHGINHFGRLWLASCIFFFATVGLAAWLARISYHIQTFSGQYERQMKFE